VPDIRRPAPDIRRPVLDIRRPVPDIRIPVPDIRRPVPDMVMVLSRLAGASLSSQLDIRIMAPLICLKMKSS
jgi:hypothetical protein